MEPETASDIAPLDQVILNMVEIFMENATKNKIHKDKLPELLNSAITSTELTEKLKPDEITRAIENLGKKEDDDKIDFIEFSRCVTILAKRYFHMKIGKVMKGEEGNKGDKGKVDNEVDEDDKGCKGCKDKKDAEGDEGDKCDNGGKGKGQKKDKDGEKDGKQEE